MKHAPLYLHCSLCGLDFEKTDTVCQRGCPLGVACGHVRCPNCAFEFPEPRRPAQWLRRILGRRGRLDLRALEGATVTLDRLDSGTRCRLQHLGCRSHGRRNTLTVFGMTPGTEIELLQRQPSFVVRVGETEVGLDEEIAREIYVKPI
ncbi:MAG TPA: FeoA family protein [Candidatus Polarisedimenticolaceae bacterium]|nr:FeoA family protein [Candidatus Polarisedimenticolaceae bacterium]